ncbi:Swi5-domain-containing protein [Scheffersomyces amazonensis]|uniref:Swi5-domain-containing protein n=1 Tax=Scheffersomyces amazonensis TaxID=1078765 RepID=UPI00315CF764
MNDSIQLSALTAEATEKSNLSTTVMSTRLSPHICTTNDQIIVASKNSDPSASLTIAQPSVIEPPPPSSSSTISTCCNYTSCRSKIPDSSIHSNTGIQNINKVTVPETANILNIDHPTLNNTPRSQTDINNAQELPSSSESQLLSPNQPTAAEIIQQRLQLKEQNLIDIKNQCSLLISELDSNQDPEAVVKKHVMQLKKYNDLKDIALDLVRLIAEQRHVKTTDLFNLSENENKEN